MECIFLIKFYLRSQMTLTGCKVNGYFANACYNAVFHFANG